MHFGFWWWEVTIQRGLVDLGRRGVGGEKKVRTTRGRRSPAGSASKLFFVLGSGRCCGWTACPWGWNGLGLAGLAELGWAALHCNALQALEDRCKWGGALLSASRARGVRGVWDGRDGESSFAAIDACAAIPILKNLTRVLPWPGCSKCQGPRPASWVRAISIILC